MVGDVKVTAMTATECWLLAALGGRFCKVSAVPSAGCPEKSRVCPFSYMHRAVRSRFCMWIAENCRCFTRFVAQLPIPPLP
jgi:hypothetical protein